MHIDEALTHFLRAQNAALLSPKTINWYEYELRQFFKWLDQQSYRNGNWLQPYVIDAYLADGRARNLAPATISGKYRALSGFFNWLVQRKYIQESPVKALPASHVPKKAPRRTELDEYLQLVESIPQVTWLELRDWLIIKILTAYD
jgi:integrase/recombinase XerC